MPDSNTTLHADYLDTLLRYYEEEISGEAYFLGLADIYSHTEKVTLLAKVERKAATAVAPLLVKYDLTPAPPARLREVGLSHLADQRNYSWAEFMHYIVRRYPLYLDEFHQLEAMAPAADLPKIQQMTAHEVAAIEFAELELAGDAGSLQPLRRYLDG